MKQTAKTIVERIVSEQATGVQENRLGIGPFYSGPKNTNGLVTPGGDLLTDTEAYDLLREGRSVDVPNAGAGSFREFFTRVGFSKIERWDSTSSAGDWSFCVQDGKEGDWYAAFQSNRYPYHGFQYSVNFDEPFSSFEDFCQFNS